MNTEIIIQFLLAVLWGGVVGAEREYRSKSAGFRTMIMISVGSCFFTRMSLLIGHDNNPDRIASNIVTGIGFIGAGVIFHQSNRVNGITTAATIWAVAAVGMGIGAGYYASAGVASVLIVLILVILPYLERRIDTYNQAKDYTVACSVEDALQEKYEHLLKKYHLKYRLTGQTKEGDNVSITWQVYGHEKQHKKFIKEIMNDNSVRKFEY